MKRGENERHGLRLLVNSQPSSVRVSASRFHSNCVIHPATARSMERKGWITISRDAVIMAELTAKGREAYATLDA